MSDGLVRVRGEFVGGSPVPGGVGGGVVLFTNESDAGFAARGALEGGDAPPVMQDDENVFACDKVRAEVEGFDGDVRGDEAEYAVEDEVSVEPDAGGGSAAKSACVLVPLLPGVHVKILRK